MKVSFPPTQSTQAKLVKPANTPTSPKSNQPAGASRPIDGNSLVKWLGHSIEGPACQLALANMGLSVSGKSLYGNCAQWQAGRSLCLELLESRDYRQRTGLIPSSQGKWILAGIQFCRAEYAPDCRQDFRGTLPFGLALTDTATELDAVLGRAALDVFYENPDQYFRVMGWVRGNIYIGIAWQNTLDTARINCCGVSMLGSKLGWGEAWLDEDIAEELDRAV